MLNKRLSQLHDWFISEGRLTTPSCAKPQKDPTVLCLKTASGVHWHNLMNAHWRICWWWSPTGWRCRKTTQCCFCYDESCSLLLWLSIAHWRICWCSLLMTNSHWLMKMPTGCFADVFETFSLTTTCQFHWHFPPFVSWKERQSSPKYIWTPPPFKCRRVSLLYSLIQLHESTIICSLLAALCVIIVGCRTETIVWLWMTIPKDQSIHNVSSIWLIFVGCDIFLRNDWACHNGNKDGDQNTDLPYDRFFYNENVSVGHQLQVACNSVCLQLS